MNVLGRCEVRIERLGGLPLKDDAVADRDHDPKRAVCHMGYFVLPFRSEKLILDRALFDRPTR